MKKYRRWLGSVFILVVIAILAAAGITYYVDPFFRFREPRESLYYANPPEANANPGIVKNFSYDSILMGSSMTENFKVSWFQEEFGLNTIKATSAGAAPKNLEILLSRAYEYHPDIQAVFWGIDVHTLFESADKPRYSLPEYMYEEGLENDLKYVLYNDAFYRSIFNIVGTFRHQKSITRDDMYAWYEKRTFGKEVVLAEYSSRPNALLQNPDAKPMNYYEKDVKANFENLMKPLIEENPDTEFYFFFTPGSILFWYDAWIQGELDAYLYNEEYLMGELLQYDNVSVFFFQNDTDIICNLDNYADTYHYNIDVNHYMAKCFSTGEHQVTAENYKDAIQSLKNTVHTYNYSEIFTPSAD